MLLEWNFNWKGEKIVDIDEAKQLGLDVEKELLSDGELLDIIYDWMGRIIKYSNSYEIVGIDLAEDILKFLKDNEEEKSNE